MREANPLPTNVVASMTHCVGYRAAAVAHVDDILALGVDAEPNWRIPDRDLLEAVTVPEERLWLPRLVAQLPDVCWTGLRSAQRRVFTRPGIHSPVANWSSRMR